MMTNSGGGGSHSSAAVMATDELPQFPYPPHDLHTHNTIPSHDNHPTTHQSKNSSKQRRSSQNTKDQSRNHRPPRILVSKPDPQKYKIYTFQHPANAMPLSIQTVDLLHRIAFYTRTPSAASSACLRRMLAEMDRVRGSRSTVGSVIDYEKQSGGNNIILVGLVQVLTTCHNWSLCTAVLLYCNHHCYEGIIIL